MATKGCKSDFGDIRRIDGKNYYKHYVCRSKACAKKQAAALKKRVMDVVHPKTFELKCSVRSFKERQGYGIWMWRSMPSGTRRGTAPTVGTKPRNRR